jgi:hypothetical protein
MHSSKLRATGRRTKAWAGGQGKEPGCAEKEHRAAIATYLVHHTHRWEREADG